MLILFCCKVNPHKNNQDYSRNLFHQIYQQFNDFNGKVIKSMKSHFRKWHGLVINHFGFQTGFNFLFNLIDTLKLSVYINKTYLIEATSKVALVLKWWLASKLKLTSPVDAPLLPLFDLKTRKQKFRIFVINKMS